jgi:prepilin-type N-terminal cleavage/methylation domain-containing protein
MMRKTLLGKRANKRGSAGFTLTEMLVTMLIMVLASTLLATGIPVAIDAYHKTVNSSNAQVSLSTTLTVLRSEIGTSSDVRIANNAIYYRSEEGYWASIRNSNKYQGLEKVYYNYTSELSPDERDNVDALLGTEMADMTYPLVSDATLQGTRSLYVEFDPSTLKFGEKSGGVLDYGQLEVSLSVKFAKGAEEKPITEVERYCILLRFN